MTDLVVVDQRFESDPAKVVLKFKVALQADPQSVRIPIGARLVNAEFITIAESDGMFLLWYECDNNLIQTRLDHVFQIWATGDDNIPKSAKHVHTGIEWLLPDYAKSDIRLARPDRVWHLYEYPSGAKIVRHVIGVV